MVLTKEATRFMHCGGALGRERLVWNSVSGSSVRVAVASDSHVHLHVNVYNMLLLIIPVLLMLVLVRVLVYSSSVSAPNRELCYRTSIRWNDIKWIQRYQRLTSNAVA